MKTKIYLFLIFLAICLSAWAGWRGDLNGDGNVDVSDVNIMIDMVLGKADKDLNKADLKKDGLVDVSDVSMLIDIVLGKAPLEEDITRTTYTVNGVSFDMVEVKGGTFTMGATAEQGSDAENDEKPAHQVTLTDFSIGQTEVTQELWQAVMGSNPSHFKGDLQRPVEQISWYDCQEFIYKLNQLVTLEDGYSFRLPTEAEWEYAARGGENSKGYKHSGSNNIDEVAWYKENSNATTHPTAQKTANELGLYDMNGNVFEWCLDWYSFSYYSESPSMNPTGPSEANNRVRRGGGYDFSEKANRVSYRHNLLPANSSPSIGLRLVIAPIKQIEMYTVNGVSFTMVPVEGGTFTMGARDNDSDAADDEKPAHQVTLTDFSIGQTEVTQELWQAVMGSNPSHFTGNLHRPMECVSWGDCQKFITKLNQLTGKTFRLPTEAEWEYAARGGNKSKGYIYSGSDNCWEVAWYLYNTASYRTTQPVGNKAPNELGIFDMSGNVDEWCQDWYGAYSSEPTLNPVGPSSGTHRVKRGGSWGSLERCRVSSRTYNYSTFKDEYIGLRLVLSQNEIYTVNGVSFNMMHVDGGTFTMGATVEQGNVYDDDELPTHQVTLNSYSIGQTEVTQELWVAVMGNNPSSNHSNLQCPVEWVSWENCQSFITKLNQLTGETFRLPTEAEWEFAARGGKKSKGYKYAGSNVANEVAWYWGTSNIHPVGEKAANELGLYDMSGNCWEWCYDWYGEYTSAPQINPTGPQSGEQHVLRGGSYKSDKTLSRVSSRASYDSGMNDITLRLAK